MKALGFLLATMIAAPAMALECPATVKVEVEGLKSFSADDSRIVNEIFKLGQRQTAKEYIEAVLHSVNKITDLTDILKLQKRRSSDIQCVYSGSNSKLMLYPKTYSQSAMAVLMIGYVNYKGTSGYNPVSAKGYQLGLGSALKKLDATVVEVYKSKKSILNLELNVQYPLGDYGTEEFNELADVGSAESVTYTAIN